MRKCLIVAVMAGLLATAACSMNTKGMGVGASGQWNNGPAVRADVDGPEFSIENPLAPLAKVFTPEPPPAPAPDPAVLDRLSKAEADLAAAVEAGRVTAQEAADLRAEIAQLRKEEMEEPAVGEEPAPVSQVVPKVIVERGPGFIGRVLSGDVVGALLGPEGVIASVLMLLGVGKGRKAWKKRKADKAAREERLKAAEAKIAAKSAPPA
jgi:hypothetical protein